MNSHTLTKHEHGKRLVRFSLWTLIGVPIGIVFLTIWATIVDTSPTLSEEERVRGWVTVVRELPATLFLVSTVLVGVVLIVRAGILGEKPAALRVLWIHAIALIFVLQIVVGGSVENVMTSRPSTVKWILFVVELGVVAGVVFGARQIIRKDTLD